MEAPDRRLARNEALFREVNETVQALQLASDDESALHEFFCECSDVECTMRVKLTHGEYEVARAEGTRFLVACGHERLDIERIVLENERYLLVEKTGGGGDEAANLDPRK